MSDRIFVQGEEIRWREPSKRTWHVGYVVGRRHQRLIVRLPSGEEREMSSKHVKEIV